MASLPVAEAREDVAVLFLSYLGRAPEFTAMNYYVGLYNQLLAAQGTNAAAADNAFKALSAQIYVDAGNIGEIPAGPSVTDAEYVNWIYQNVLGRAADTDGLNYWLTQLGSGAIERADLVGIVVAAAQNDERDAAYLANRTDVALEFAKFENSNAQILASLPFNAKQVLEGVNEDDATVAAAQDKLYTATNGGESVTLTPGVDNIVGTSGDDVFNAVPVNAADSAPVTTLNAFDTIDGGAGRDTLNIYSDGVHNTVQQGTIRNVEVINIYNVTSGSAFGGSSVDASKFAGAEEVWQHGRAVDVKGLAASTVAGFADLTAIELNVSAADAAAKATVVLDNVTANGGDLSLDFNGKALKDVVILGAVANADDAEVLVSINNTDAKAKNLTVSLATEVAATVFLTSANIVALDASASTGAIEYTFDGNVKSVIGGSGDDVFVLTRALGLTDSIDGGQGRDTVILAGQGAVLATQDYDAIATLKNIEVLGFQTTAISFDAAKLSAFDQIGLIGDGSATVSNLSAEQTLLVDGTRTVTLTDAAADVNVQLFVDSDASLVINETKKVVGGTLAVTGEGEFSYDNAGGKFASIDVSELQGSFNLLGLSSTVAETVTLGDKSADTIILQIGTADTAGTSTYAVMDTILGFNATASDDAPVDKQFGVQVTQSITIDSSVTALNDAFALAASAYDGSIVGNDVLLFQFKGDTYLYADNNDDGKYGDNDFAIKFVGLYTAEDFTLID